MKIEENKYQHILIIADQQGKNEISIHKDGSQFQVETGIQDGSGEIVFINTDKKELKALRDIINKIIGE